MVNDLFISEEQDKICKQNEIVKDKIVKILSSKQKLNATVYEVKT